MAVLGLAGSWAFGQYVQIKDRCTGAEAELAGLWDDARKQEVEAAILGTRLSYARGTWERVEPRLDAYAEEWAAAHLDVWAPIEAEVLAKPEYQGQLNQFTASALRMELASRKIAAAESAGSPVPAAHGTTTEGGTT